MDAALGHSANVTANRYPASQNGREQGKTLVDGEEPPRLRAGFGQGTVTAPAAALQTLNRGVRAAAETAPSLEELQAAQRASRTEDRKPLQDNGLHRPLRAETRETYSSYDRNAARRVSAESHVDPPAETRLEQTARAESAPTDAPEPPRQDAAPTGPNALSGQRLNILA